MKPKVYMPIDNFNQKIKISAIKKEIEELENTLLEAEIFDNDSQIFTDFLRKIEKNYTKFFMWHRSLDNNPKELHRFGYTSEETNSLVIDFKGDFEIFSQFHKMKANNLINEHFTIIAQVENTKQDFSHCFLFSLKELTHSVLVQIDDDGDIDYQLLLEKDYKDFFNLDQIEAFNEKKQLENQIKQTNIKKSQQKI